MIASNNRISIGDFEFRVKTDHSGDPLSAIEVFVFFRNEPCCDDNGHQYRFYLPIGLAETSLQDVCCSFALAVHCDLGAAAA